MKGKSANYAGSTRRTFPLRSYVSVDYSIKKQLQSSTVLQPFTSKLGQGGAPKAPYVNALKFFVSKAPMTGITAITSLKFDVGCDVGRGYGSQRELYLRDSTLAVWSGKWCRVCIGLPNLKEIRIGCEVLYHSTDCWDFWRVDEGTTDFSHLIGISIVVEPEEVDNSSIDEFDGDLVFISRCLTARSTLTRTRQVIQYLYMIRHDRKTDEYTVSSAPLPTYFN